jgi:GTP cyclohydrolase IB
MPLSSLPTPLPLSVDATPSAHADFLEDVQGRVDERNIALQSAGVSNVEMPLSILQPNGETQVVAANVSMAVSLNPDEKGTHMSRFIVQLGEWSKHNTLSLNTLPDFARELSTRLDAASTEADIAFTYFMDKAAPVTQQSAPMGYPVRYSVKQDGASSESSLSIQVPISTLCPCSKSISDFGAHNQRALVDVTLKLTKAVEAHPLWVEDLVALVDDAASCPVYPLLKRQDEKWVTERQYMNPKFVEDVARDLTLVLRDESRCSGFSIRVEALESIHAHNAWAAHSEGL